MDLTLIATFLDLASTGSFSRTAERVHITQLAVSARVKTLEQALGCRLFERDHNGTILTEAGQRFLSYANNINRLWLQGRQEAASKAGTASQIAAGLHICLWRRLSLPWTDAVRSLKPTIRLRLETAYSEFLSKLVEDGTLDFAVVYTPQALPGLQSEKLFEDRLVIVSDREGDAITDLVDRYIYIDWGYGYRQRHAELLPEFAVPYTTIGNPEAALEYIRKHGGSAYFPFADIATNLADKELHIVAAAPVIRRPCYLTYPEKSGKPDLLAVGLDAMRKLVLQLGLLEDQASGNLSRSFVLR